MHDKEVKNDKYFIFEFMFFYLATNWNRYLLNVDALFEHELYKRYINNDRKLVHFPNKPIQIIVYVLILYVHWCKFYWKLSNAEEKKLPTTATVPTKFGATKSYMNVLHREGGTEVPWVPPGTPIFWGFYRVKNGK